MSVVCPRLETLLPCGMETSCGKERIAYIFCRFDDNLCVFFSSPFWFLRTSLLGIVRELAGGGSVAVSVGVTER